MERTLTEEREEEVWEALSDAFIDNEVHYEFIARRVLGIPLGELKGKFFLQVAPLCGPNLLATIPPMWEGYDRQALAESIREMLACNQHSALARLRHRIVVAFFRWHCRDIWKEIETELRKKAAQPVG